eukprot:TRINITY_DN7033_c0_g2_i1.p1 TRINITY_DN7033_c0_g2~~TRINITY_DN7033_c0_g2_i1.p1  ORF type:complete len:542 (-),score=51.65 TRINITY_DN7033_c0_g2_i1:93-1718(-)
MSMVGGIHQFSTRRSFPGFDGVVCCGLVVAAIFVGSVKAVGGDTDHTVDYYNTHDIIYDSGSWLRIPNPFVDGGPRPYSAVIDVNSEAVRNIQSILVLVASRQEPKLVETLSSMFARARFPERVYAGVIQQNTLSDVDGLEGLCNELGTPLMLRETFRGRADLHVRQTDDGLWGQDRYTPESLVACGPAARVRIYRMDSSEAKGPAYARSRQPLLLGDSDTLEQFCMQIDAHTLFAQNWDDGILKDWAATDNEYAVLSTKPPPMETLTREGVVTNINNHWEMPFLCEANMLEPGLVQTARAWAVANLDRPCLSRLWTAGLSFSRCHAERDVPTDPEMRGIFDGEDFSRGARLWTNGYDFYAMTRPFISHDYGGRVDTFGSPSERMEARKRQMTLLHHRNADMSFKATEALKGYDLGSRRKFDDYVNFSGVDTINHEYKKGQCAVDRWIPWLPQSTGPNLELPNSPKKLGVDIATLLGVAPEARAVESRPLFSPFGVNSRAFILRETYDDVMWGCVATFSVVIICVCLGISKLCRRRRMKTP